eukprot:4878759-Ditylum_brightwellii.AAC.1
MKAIIQQELLPVREVMEIANTLSLEAAREVVELQHEETVEGDHTESGWWQQCHCFIISA